MTDAGRLCVTGYGAVTAVGLTAVQAAASVRAGVSRFLEHPLAWSKVDPPYVLEPEPLVCAPVATLDPWLREPDRVLNLALAPLQEVIVSARLARDDFAGAGLFLAVPADFGVDDAVFLHEFQRRAALRPLSPGRLLRHGPTGFYHALAAARAAVAGGACRAALVGGVDTHLGEATIRRLDEAGRLKSARNRDGFVPGEAAGWLWLEPRARAAQRGAPVRAAFHGWATAREEQPFTGERQSTGTGLTEALRAVIDAAALAPQWVVCDLNGESYRGFEWGVARTRLGAQLDGLRELTHPADCWGDVGAAGPPLHAALACEAFRRRWAPAGRAHLFAGEDGGERGAAVLAAESD